MSLCAAIPAKKSSLHSPMALPGVTFANHTAQLGRDPPIAPSDRHCCHQLGEPDKMESIRISGVGGSRPHCRANSAEVAQAAAARTPRRS
jgi:hypothetical protein